MRSTFSTLCLSSMLLLAGITASAADIAPEALVQRGIDNYRAARYQDAATDLTAAAQAILSSDQMQKYVDTGKFENLGRLDTALVYLALAESKLGHDPAARDAILRLTTAERIEPLYARLPLQADAADFETLVKRVAPGTSLAPNVYLARGGAPAGASTQIAQTAPPPSATTVASVPAPTSPSTTTGPKPAATPTTQTAQSTPSPALAPSHQQPAQTSQTAAKPAEPSSAERDRERYIEQRLAEERAKIEKVADERIAAERIAAQRELEERVRVERAAAQKQAEQQIAVVQKNAQQQIEAAQKKAQEQVAAAQRDAEQRVAAAQKGSRTDHLASVREADSLAIKGKLDSARRLYAVVANAPDAGRDVLAEAAVGLYRTGGFREAVNAFRRVAPFAHGEEDLRYYNAVVLYESGDYTDAKKELACALPFIDRSDDVTRYQAKIELTGLQ